MLAAVKITLVLAAAVTVASGEDGSSPGDDQRDFKLTVIVLTMNRARSLSRLLESIRNTDLESEDDYFDLEIHVDKSIGAHYQDCVSIARNFTLPHAGKVRARIADKNHGLRAAWFDAWYPRPDDEYALIVEDDLELSPYWYTWLKKAWTKYGGRDDLAGIALHRQFMVMTKPEQTTVEIINNFEPFLYKLVGTWGFSPHPKRWREFLDWFHSVDSETFDPFVPGLITSDWLHQHTTMGKRHMTWEQWHIYHSEKNGLFTMYLNLPKKMALCSNWREAGVHYRHSFDSPDYPTVDYCAIQLQEFPDELRKYGWDAKEIKDVDDGRVILDFEFNS